MKTTAMKLRELVTDNRFESGRLNREQLGKEDYAELTQLYRNALDALTEWANADYNHKKDVKAEKDASFTAVKAILALYETGDNYIAINEQSIRSIRDMSTKAQRQYSDAYKKVAKALKNQKATVEKNLTILVQLGATLPTDDQDLNEWKAQAIAEGKHIFEGINMAETYVASVVHLKSCELAVETVKKAGKWTWRRMVSQGEAVFADLVENYVGDALEDGYNLKTSKAIRDEQAQARKEAREAKAQANATK